MIKIHRLCHQSGFNLCDIKISRSCGRTYSIIMRRMYSDELKISLNATVQLPDVADILKVSERLKKNDSSHLSLENESNIVEHCSAIGGSSSPRNNSQHKMPQHCHKVGHHEKTDTKTHKTSVFRASNTSFWYFEHQKYR